MDDVAQTRMRETAAFIDQHLAEFADLPPETTGLGGHEAELLKVAASHREFLEFVRWHLRVPLWYSAKSEGQEHFAPGHFERFMLRSVMKPRVEGEVVIEYGEPINFIAEGVEGPKAALTTSKAGSVAGTPKSAGSETLFADVLLARDKEERQIAYGGPIEYFDAVPTSPASKSDDSSRD